jgi:dienelactone hydrolase
MAPFLLQVASQGVVVIATGPKEDPAKGGTFGSFGTYGQVQPKAMSDAMDWAEKVSSDPKWAHIDMSRVAAGGQSCGGMLAYTVEHDKRIKAIGIFNSGNFAKDSGGDVKGGAKGGKLMVFTDVTKFTKPIFYFLGGAKDVAYQNVSAFVSRGLTGWFLHI